MAAVVLGQAGLARLVEPADSPGPKGHFTKAKSPRLVKACSFFFGVVEERLVGLQEIRYKC